MKHVHCPLSQCGKAYGCRLCHDDNEISHGMDRFSVREVVCNNCSKQQPVSNVCCKCGVTFGQYYCSICHLYDNDTDKGQFHCEQCGLCRIGGQENFFHCDQCGYCLAKDMMDTHKCRKDNSKNNCPVCMEDIHTSRDPAHVPQCGHLIHTSCYKELLKKGLYQCPQCQTSLADMKSVWTHQDEEIGAWEMPHHLRDFKVKVKCRDCHEETETVFHVMGLKCMMESCGSYNTVRCGNEEVPEDAVPVRAQELLDHLQQQQNHDNDQQDEQENVE